MTITVLDTATGMNTVLTADEPERPELVRALLRPMEGMFRYYPGDVDLLPMHTMSMGFPIDRRVDETREALARLEPRTLEPDRARTRRCGRRAVPRHP